MESSGSPSLEFLRHPIVWLVTVVRFLAAVLILIHPLIGFAVSVVFDFIDALVILHILGYSRETYHSWDKVVDWFAYITEFLVAITYGLYLPFFILLFWRFAGQFMFMRTQKTAYFILFPNLFETAFLWLILFYPRVLPVDLWQSPVLYWLLYFFIVKEIHEISLHYIWPKMLPRVGDKTAGFWKRLFGIRVSS